MSLEKRPRGITREEKARRRAEAYEKAFGYPPLQGVPTMQHLGGEEVIEATKLESYYHSASDENPFAPTRWQPGKIG